MEPLSLQALCRALIRNILRKTIETEHPSVKKSKRPPITRAPKKKRALRRLVVPLFESEDSSDDERHVRIGLVSYTANHSVLTFVEKSNDLCRK